MPVNQDRLTRGPGRIMGIDLGERRIGVAIGESVAHTASPFTTLSRGKTVDDDATVISRLASEQGAAELVVGLPLNMDGSEGLQATRTREWAEAVAVASGLALRFRDERLTSERAERRIGKASRGRSGGPPSPAQLEAYRARIDREAASLILQDDLDATSTDNPDRRFT